MMSFRPKRLKGASGEIYGLDTNCADPSTPLRSAPDDIRKLAFRIALYIATGAFLYPLQALAQASAPPDPLQVLKNTGTAAKIDTERQIGTVVGGVIQAFLTTLGIIFVVLIVFGGFRWMLAGGEEKKVKEALGMMMQGVIGLAIVLGAYAITAFVTGALQKAVNLQ